MRATIATYARDAEVFSIAARDPDGRIVGGALFQRTGGTVQFLGSEPCDYLDVVVDRSLHPSLAATCKRQILRSAFLDRGTPRALHLVKLPLDERTPEVLAQRFEDVHVVALRTWPAPTMDMDNVQAALRSKNVKRCENRLKRNGSVECQTYLDTGEVHARLPALFDQHVRRWQGTTSPSLFENEVDREFYRRLTTELAGTGKLRYTELRLDGKLMAAHYGFFDAGRFVWYKPSYEPTMAELSPGVVLLARLMERAAEESAAELDFTIGDESFKSRYATRERAVVDLLLTRSWAVANGKRLWLSKRDEVKKILDRFGMLTAVKRLLRR